MKLYSFIIVLMAVAMTLTTVTVVSAQEPPINYGPEWEDIRQSYQKITKSYTQQRTAILGNLKLNSAEQTRQIQAAYDQFMNKSRKLAVRRSEIINIAAKRSGLKYTLGSDPAKGRGMAGDIDLGGTPLQARKFMEELKKIGIADAFDEVGSITRKPGYVSLKVPMDVTVNYEGALGKVGSSSYENQIAVDARSKEVYLSVAMEKNQPGRKAVETLDHIRKARQGLKTPHTKILNHPEALQVACKGTFKAMVEMRVSDPELHVILKKSGLKMAPDEFLNTLDKIRKGNNIAPELAGVTKKNIKGLYRALDETTRVCQNKALQSFQKDMTIARGVEGTLRQSKDPGIRNQLPKTRAVMIDSTVRMRENLNALFEMDQTHPQGMKDANRLKVHNDKMKLWLNTIQEGVSRPPHGSTVFGESKKFRLPGTQTLNDMVSRRIKGYQAFRNNARITTVSSKGMQAVGSIMAGTSWYYSAKANGDSDFWAASKAVVAGVGSLTRFGSMAMEASDLEYHMTVKAENHRKDQEMRYTLMGLDTENQKVKDLINTRVLVRKGVYGIVKTTSYSSMFMAHPALIVTGAALEAGLAVYEAHEEASLWEHYADKLEKANQATDRNLMERGAYVSTRIARNINAHALRLAKVVQSYHDLMKEQERIVDMQKKFINNNAAYHTYLEGLAKTLKSVEKPQNIDMSHARAILTTLKQVEAQARQCISQINKAAALSQNSDTIDGAHSILVAMTSEYQALTMQLEMSRPVVIQLTAQNQVAPMTSPVASLKAYQQQMAVLESILKPRSQAVGALLSNSRSIGEQINTMTLRRKEYLGTKTSPGRISRYKVYLSRQSGPEAAAALARVNSALVAIKAVEIPVWKSGYITKLQHYYAQIRELLKQVQASRELVSTFYPEPIGSLYKNIQPQTVALSPEISQQWQKSGVAITDFYSALSSLRAMLGQPQEEEETPEQEEDAEYSEWDSNELKRELARLQALKAELKKRSDANIADLTRAYFADSDALWKAYLAAFKEPKMMTCENCKTQTLHSMDYSDNPPSVWCNVCGRILSFKRWSGGGRSLASIHQQGQTKKAAIKSQLAANLRAVDMAINQVNEAMGRK